MILGFESCSPLTFKPPAPPLDEETVRSIVSAFAKQEKAAKTLFFSGSVTIKDRRSENSAQILMIADVKNCPFEKNRAFLPCGRIKIEITHTWGKSLLHLLVNGQRLEILNFNEKRFYQGTLKSSQIASLLPIPLNRAIIWSMARAFPALLAYSRATSQKEGEITLADASGAVVQVFHLYSGEPLPLRVLFTKENAEMVFSDYDEEDGILYAKKMRFHSLTQEISLAIEIDQMKFNVQIPETVFEMVPPHDFQTVLLGHGETEQ
jgi:hypothetical protein